jgi:hypothetical protein
VHKTHLLLNFLSTLVLICTFLNPFLDLKAIHAYNLEELEGEGNVSYEERQLSVESKESTSTSVMEETWMSINGPIFRS